MAALSAAEGPFESVGPAITFQKNEWFQWPPPLLRTAVAMSAGSWPVPTSAFSSTSPVPLNSGNFSSLRGGGGGGDEWTHNKKRQMRGRSDLFWYKRCTKLRELERMDQESK
jgi:hypothetical protein